ncbi:MAG: F0F1 ATP synthase subunit B [Phycisphaerae bacterium]|nr:F0F1 ATP synthase subunit B [Phycisphaerae bacterium]
MKNGEEGLRLLHIIVVTTTVFAAPSLAAAEEGGGTPYPGDLGQAVATLLIFVALLVVLGKYAWKPIVAQLQRREDDIASKIDDARKRQAEADELVRDYGEKLQHIELKVDEMMAQGRQEVEKQRRDILAATQQEAHQSLQRARDDIAAAGQAARRELQAETARLAADLAEQFLAESLTAADQDRLIEQSTRQLASPGGEDDA